jgi:ketosteroid isomerase-like protein
MSRLLKATLFAALLMALSQAFAQSAEDAISKLEDQRYDAMMAVDEATLKKILAEDFVYHQLNGKIATRDSYIANLKSGNVKINGYKRYDVKTRVYGDTVVVQGKTNVDAVINGEEKKINLMYTNVWRKQGPGWQLVARQSTNVAP